MFLPDHSVRHLRRALHQLYTAGDTLTLASILGLTNHHHHMEEEEGQEEEEEVGCPNMLSSDCLWDDEGSLHEAQEEYFAQQDYFESSEEEEKDDSDDDSLVGEDEDSLTGEYKGKQSEIFLTSTECKRSPIKSIGRETVEGLGLCFVSPISKDYEEPEPGEGEVGFISIWFFIK